MLAYTIDVESLAGHGHWTAPGERHGRAPYLISSTRDSAITDLLLLLQACNNHIGSRSATRLPSSTTNYRRRSAGIGKNCAENGETEAQSCKNVQKLRRFSTESHYTWLLDVELFRK